MVHINGAYQFVVYDLDTQQSAINRLAAEMRTLPKYLYFTDGIPTIAQFRDEDGNIHMEDLLKVITTDNTGYNFVPIFEQVKDKLSQQKLNIREDIFTPFVAFNKTLVDADVNIQGHYVVFMQSELDKTNIFADKQNIDMIWKDRKRIVDGITVAIKLNRTSVEKQKNIFLQFENISDGLPYTPFELEHVNFEFTLDMIHVTIMELFNHIQLNASVPFACINNIYKILKDFMPPDEWGFSTETAIIFKVLQKTDLTGIKIQDFTDAVLSILGEPGQDILTVGMSLITSGQYLTRDKIIERLLSVIKGLGDIRVKTIRESRVNGVFYFPKHRMNKYVLADLIMNNPIFSSMMSIDESEKASKKKESVYIHFRHPKIGAVAANITEKISEKGDPVLRGKDVKGDFKFGTNYIRVKISSADNLKSVQAFQEMFAKFMIIYDNEYQNIVDLYRLYISDFAMIVPRPPRKVQNLKLKDIAPEVFVKGYPPKCPNPPTIIGDYEVADAEAAGKIVIRYPQNDDEGFIPRNYICDYPKARFPGLRDNPLSNRDLVPFLPCCYTKNHEDRKGSIYRHYYHGEDLRIKVDADQQDLIITNKFVPKNKYGTLPDDITKLFDIFDPQEGYMYVRKGVFDTKSSFLDCVMEGMYEETEILDLQDKDEREARLYEVRNDNATAARAASCRQEMYDFTTDEIMAAIQDPDVYMDPKLFTSMLEELFDCNIYVFNRTNIRNGQLAIPRHLQAFYKTKRRTKCVFIYEHWGSTSDHATYPRCELIVRWRIGGGGEDDVAYYSTYDSKVAKGVRGVFNRMRQAYALNIEIPETEFPITNKDVKLVEQGIDSYGKCRMIRFNYKGQLGTLLTRPMQPLNIPEVQKWVATKLDQGTTLQFAATLGFPISGQSISRDVVKELYGVLGNVRVSIPVEDSLPIDGVPRLDKGVSYPENEISVVENYNHYKKLARYITEYTFWLFSQYLQEDSSRDMGLDTIRDFFQDNIKIVKDFEYGHVSKIFDMDSGVMDGGKLVLKSEETLKRLVYTLRVSLRRFRKKIREYHTRRVIENYYVDITDFDQHQFQVILQGDNSVEKWIREQKIRYNLYDSVQFGFLGIPYFFQNKLVGGQIYLAQNTDDLQKALKIAQIWLHNGYNPGENPPPASQLVQFTLYRYVNSKDITLFRVGGIPTPLDIKMLGYKVGDHSFFTVLLPLHE
jgi:hypothetical protein